MGPRARARGNHPAAATDVKNSGLQWGHERALVEITGAHALPVASRRFNGATSARSWKSGESSPAVTPHSGFNGATSARSWKSGGDGGVGEGGGASMGPRARARGNGRRAGGRGDRGAASMGPRARARGNPCAATQRNSPGRGFNGATSARSWKFARMLTLVERLQASMGPRARARGNPLERNKAELDLFASMGPRARARGNTQPPTGADRSNRSFNGATSARSWK